jgi:hypothetical protein
MQVSVCRVLGLSSPRNGTSSCRFKKNPRQRPCLGRWKAGTTRGAGRNADAEDGYWPSCHSNAVRTSCFPLCQGRSRTSRRPSLTAGAAVSPPHRTCPGPGRPCGRRLAGHPRRSHPVSLKQWPLPTDALGYRPNGAHSEALRRGTGWEVTVDEEADPAGPVFDHDVGPRDLRSRGWLQAPARRTLIALVT